MSYILKLNSPDDLSPTQAKAAEKIYRKHLDEQIGDASLVWPVYQAYLKIVAIYGEQPDDDLISEQEKTILETWQQAELAAISHTFGENRYMGESRFEIEAPHL